MKKFLTLSIILLAALLLSACNHNVPSSAVLNDVFYTADVPKTTSYKDLNKVTTLTSGKKYNLVASYYQPNERAVKMIMSYNGEESEYLITDDVTGVSPIIYWPGVSWSGSGTVALTFYLVDEKGRRSASKAINISIQN